MKAGFVSIIGNPNAGKSSFLNAILKQNLSICTPKAQTTRHRILGILSEDDYQIVFSDTPGIVRPHYKLQETMLEAVEESLLDADVFVLISDRGEDFKNEEIIEKIKKTSTPCIILINKIDLSNEAEIKEKIALWQNKWKEAQIIPISALHKFNIETCLQAILDKLPEHEAYYSKDDISNRNMRFFVSEIIRERILLHYQKEIPYSVEVLVTEYKETKDLDRISVLIYVEKQSQKGILIGPNGVAIKKVGTEARRKIEQMVEKKVFLEINVKVLENWRDREECLKNFGYIM